MPKAYWITTYRSIRDPEAMAAYAKLAVAAHDSADYQEALRALGDGAERDLRIVPGVDTSPTSFG